MSVSLGSEVPSNCFISPWSLDLFECVLGDLWPFVLSSCVLLQQVPYWIKLKLLLQSFPHQG
jgi:hypothetical protein